MIIMRTSTIIIEKDFRKDIILGSLITLFLLITTILNPVFGQDQIGFRGGLNISEPGLNGSLGNTNSLTRSFAGIDVALVSEFKLGKRISFRPELGYSEKGIRIGAATNLNLFGAPIPLGLETITKVRLLEVPLMAKYEFGSGPMKGYVIGGPSVAYALNGNFKTKGNFLTELNLVNENFGLGDQNRFGLGFTGGLGLEMVQGKGTFFVEARYNHQSLKINNLPIADLNFNNNGVAFNVGYKFSI